MAKPKTAAEKKKGAKRPKDQVMVPAKERTKKKKAATTPRASLPGIPKKCGASSRKKQLVPSGVTTTPAPRKNSVVLDVDDSSSDAGDDVPLIKRRKLAGDNALPVATKPDDDDDDEEEEEELEELEDEDVGDEVNEAELGGSDVSDSDDSDVEEAGRGGASSRKKSDKRPIVLTGSDSRGPIPFPKRINIIILFT